MRIFIRIINLLLFPAKEWAAIAEENNSRKKTFVQLAVPLLGVMAFATIFGTWLYTPRELYTVAYVVCRILILWTSLVAGLFLSAAVLTEIMAQKTGVKDHNKSFALMANSASAAYIVIIIVEFFPFIPEFLILALYSCYLFRLGMPKLIQVEGQKQVGYGLLALVITALTHFVMFFLFGNIFRALLL